MTGRRLSDAAQGAAEPDPPPFTVLIPARMASTRLPDKPLLEIAGLPMVVRVARRAAEAGAKSVVVAADDRRIVQACENHCVTAILTSAAHASGSDRLAEACAALHLDGDDCVVNVQGDEPLIDPRLIRRCAELLDERPECAVSTVAHPIETLEDFQNVNVVKVVLDASGRALYFTRAAVPFWRDAAVPALPFPRPLRHVGLYGYRAGFLRGFPLLEQSPLERLEALEQLRVLWHGERIAVHVAAHPCAAGVDTADDLARVRALLLR